MGFITTFIKDQLGYIGAHAIVIFLFCFTILLFPIIGFYVHFSQLLFGVVSVYIFPLKRKGPGPEFRPCETVR